MKHLFIFLLLNYRMNLESKLFCSKNCNMHTVTKDTKLITALLIVTSIWTISIVDVTNGPPRVLQAEDILFKIMQELPVGYDHVTISGDLNLTGLDLPTKHVRRTFDEANRGLSENAKIVNSSIRINDSVIFGSAELSNSIFSKPVSFEGTTFRGPASFKGTQFKEAVDLKETQFSRFADFSDARFSGPVDLEGIKFDESVNFAGSEFSTEMPLPVGFRFSQISDALGSGIIEFSNSIRSESSEVNSLLRSKLSEFSDLVRSRYYETVSLIEYQLVASIDLFRPKYHDAAVMLESYLIELARYVTAKYYETASFIKSQFTGSGSIGLEFDDTAQFAAKLLYKPGLMLKYLSVISVVVVIAFTFFWRAIGIKTPDKPADGNVSGEGRQDRRSFRRSGINTRLLLLLEALSFSMMVFLSGTKIFIDTPNSPDMPGRVKHLAAGMFVLERIIGAIAAILIFVAISRL